ncbi:MAG: SDR family NAD(P)-dependent oxidoreductase [Ruminococcaceae bacterium]|nr:SDR family NAD(P)-dependent oxidoreductase [Oscillospiraceae bacterium]
MNVEKWLRENTDSLAGKTVVISGSTGGIGRELCRYMLGLGASLILLDRNEKKAEALKSDLLADFSESTIEFVRADLENIDSVKVACASLKNMPLDAIILNAGAYSIPRHKCSTGFDNVFQINFVSPYYIAKTLLPMLAERGGRVVAVGSIAHNYSVTDPLDIDFSSRKKASLVYGNAKRYLMFALHGLFQNEMGASLAVTHPGITFTGITNHYPKLIFALIKHPMKVIFMKPRVACLSILKGLFEKCDNGEWIGPALFDIWGRPQKKLISTAKDNERKTIFETAEKIYKQIKEGSYK